MCRLRREVRMDGRRAGFLSRQRIEEPAEALQVMQAGKERKAGGHLRVAHGGDQTTNRSHRCLRPMRTTNYGAVLSFTRPAGLLPFVLSRRAGDERDCLTPDNRVNAFRINVER